MAKSRVTQGARASKARAEKPVSEGIRRAAARAGIEPADDTEGVNLDLARAALEIQFAFDDVLAAELADDKGQHDVLVLSALRRLRRAQNMVASEMGGAL